MKVKFVGQHAVPFGEQVIVPGETRLVDEAEFERLAKANRALFVILDGAAPAATPPDDDDGGETTLQLPDESTASDVAADEPAVVDVVTDEPAATDVVRPTRRRGRSQ